MAVGLLLLKEYSFLSAKSIEVRSPAARNLMPVCVPFVVRGSTRTNWTGRFQIAVDQLSVVCCEM